MLIFLETNKAIKKSFKKKDIGYWKNFIVTSETIESPSMLYCIDVPPAPSKHGTDGCVRIWWRCRTETLPIVWCARSA